MSLSFTSAGVLFSAPNGPQPTYQPTWDSIDTRPIPAWFQDAKFGIFIHWGLYAVPSWSPKGTYSEWYWSAMQDKKGPVWSFHERVYGADFKYEDFAPLFRAELFDPNEWATLFADSGAQYILPTAKHHDGFCLWPSREASQSYSRSWNSAEIGPHRDLIGELTDAVRAKGLKMGLYYSLYEWFNPLWLADFNRYRDELFFPQFKDVVTRYQPSLIFTDGEWDKTSEEWKSPELLAWLFNESPCRDEVVINDRWGKDCRSAHGGYFTTEYGEVGAGKDLAQGRPWEECRGMGASFGYNRNEDLAQYLSSRDMIHLLVDVVSRGGNLNLDIGPSADGKIPVIMQERLHDMGDWLKVNGEAIYATRPWRETREGEAIRYTRKGDALYALLLRWPGDKLQLDLPKPGPDLKATLLGVGKPLKVRRQDAGIEIELPRLTPDQLPCQHAFVVKLTGVE